MESSKGPEVTSSPLEPVLQNSVTPTSDSAAAKSMPEAQTSSDEATGAGAIKPLPPQSHSSTAQNVFAGRPTPGLMCSNLRANPFSVTENSSNSYGILAKPRFNLKPPSFSVTAAADSSNSAATDDKTSAVPAANPFLRPAKLSYGTEDVDHETGDGKDSSKEDTFSSSDIDKSGVNNVKDTNNVTESSTSDKDSNDTPAVSSSSEPDAMSTSSNARPAAASSTEGFTLGSALSSRASQSSFVFGEALDSRVTNVAKENGTNGHVESEEKPKSLTLEEAASEYIKQQESGPLLPEVETKTGEEDESNVLQTNCKLFLFNKEDNSWAEKGRGLLRLNDDTAEGVHSRIVMRTVGIHRVILNTSIWPAMLCERANQKSIRLTGTESEQVHVYLITGSPADIDHLYNAVTYRIQRLKQQLATTTPADEGSESEATSAKRKSEKTDEVSPKKQRKEGVSSEGQVAE